MSKKNAFTGIKSRQGKITYWINDKKVTKEQWETYQDAFAELRPARLLRKQR